MKKDPTLGEGHSRLCCYVCAVPVNLLVLIDCLWNNSGKSGDDDDDDEEEETAMMMRSASQLAELPSSPPGQKSD